MLDGEQAIQVDPTYVKAYYRLGCAKFSLLKYKDAKNVFKKLVALAPADKDAKLKLKQAEKLVREAKFAAAIAHEKTAPMS